MPVVYRENESGAGWMAAAMIAVVAILALVAWFVWGQPRIDASPAPDNDTTIIQPSQPDTQVVPVPVPSEPSAPSAPSAPSVPAAPSAPAAPSGE